MIAAGFLLHKLCRPQETVQDWQFSAAHLPLTARSEPIGRAGHDARGDSHQRRDRSGQRRRPGCARCLRVRRLVGSSSARRCGGCADRSPADGPDGLQGGPRPGARSRSTKPRLISSPNIAAAAPIANEPRYQIGLRRLGRESSSCSRVSHQARWSPSSLAARRMKSRVVLERDRAAWPRYRPWAAISPAWLTRISPAAWRFSASVSGESGGKGGLRTPGAGANSVRSVSSATLSAESSMSLASIRALYVMWLGKPPLAGPERILQSSGSLSRLPRLFEFHSWDSPRRGLK